MRYVLALWEFGSSLGDRLTRASRLGQSTLGQCGVDLIVGRRGLRYSLFVVYAPCCFSFEASTNFIV